MSYLYVIKNHLHNINIRKFDHFIRDNFIFKENMLGYPWTKFINLNIFYRIHFPLLDIQL